MEDTLYLLRAWRLRLQVNQNFITGCSVSHIWCYIQYIWISTHHLCALLDRSTWMDWFCYGFNFFYNYSKSNNFITFHLFHQVLLWIIWQQTSCMVYFYREGFLFYSYLVKFVVFWWTPNIFFSYKLYFYLFFKILRNMLYRGSEVSAQKRKVQPFLQQFSPMTGPFKSKLPLLILFLAKWESHLESI